MQRGVCETLWYAGTVVYLRQMQWKCKCVFVSAGVFIIIQKNTQIRDFGGIKMGAIMVEKLEHFLYKICDCKLNEIINLINCSKLKLLTVNCQKNIAKSYYYAALISRKIQARIKKL